MYYKGNINKNMKNGIQRSKKSKILLYRRN